MQIYCKPNKKKISNMKKIFILFFIPLFYISCNNEEVENNNIPDTIDTTDVITVIKNVYYSLPSPIEMAIVVKKYTTEFTTDSLHKTSMATNYNTTKAMALNLGVYSADMAFFSIYEQYNQSNEYFETIINLANSLEIVEGINDTLLNDVQANLDDPQAIKEIIAEAFFKSDAYLKENNKEYVASLILTGAWVESLYLLSNFLEGQSDTCEIYYLFIDQRLILENVRKIISTIVDQNIVAMLDELQVMLDECVILSSEEVYDEYTDTMRTKTVVEYNINIDYITEIRKKISKIRKIFISLQ